MRVQPRRKILTSRRRVARRIRGCVGTRAVTSGTVLAGMVSSAAPPTLSSHRVATATANHRRAARSGLVMWVRCHGHPARLVICKPCAIHARAGWPWQRTHMTKPERAARLWLAVAVATLWLLSVGGEAEETIPVSTVPDVTALLPTQPRMRRATRLRLVSIFRRGWTLILVALLDQAPLPMGCFVPEPWPAVTALEAHAPL